MDGLTEWIQLYDSAQKAGFPVLLAVVIYCLVKPVYVHKNLYDDAKKRADDAIEAAKKTTDFAWDQLKTYIELGRSSRK